jgi:hypothetical protein
MSLRDQTNTRGLNRTDYYHFVSPAEQSKDNPFFTDIPQRSDWPAHGVCRLRELIGQFT